MRNRYETADLAAEQHRALYALASSPQPNLIQRTLVYATSDRVRNQDAASLVRRVALHSVLGRFLAWPFIRSHWESFMNRYQHGNSQFNGLLMALAKTAASTSDVNEISSWVHERYQYASIPVSRGQERAVQRWKWLDENRPLLADWFTSH